MTLTTYDVLSQAADQSAKTRLDYLTQNLGHLSSSDLIAAIDSVITVASDYASSCNEAVWLHLMVNGQYPNGVDHLNVPSFSAAIKGLTLIDIAINTSKLCDTCAYRAGTLGNHSQTTQSDVEHALADGAVFYCHNDAKGTVKMKACQGYVQHNKQA